MKKMIAMLVMGGALMAFTVGCGPSGTTGTGTTSVKTDKGTTEVKTGKDKEVTVDKDKGVEVKNKDNKEAPKDK